LARDFAETPQGIFVNIGGVPVFFTTKTRERKTSRKDKGVTVLT